MIVITCDSNGRPIRENRGRGGAIAQLEAVSKEIHKPARAPRAPQPATSIPEDTPVNAMAPPVTKKRRDAQPVSNYILILVRGNRITQEERSQVY